MSSIKWGAPPQSKSHIKHEIKKNFQNVIVRQINTKLNVIF